MNWPLLAELQVPAQALVQVLVVEVVEVVQLQLLQVLVPTSIHSEYKHSCPGELQGL